MNDGTNSVGLPPAAAPPAPAAPPSAAPASAPASLFAPGAHPARPAAPATAAVAPKPRNVRRVSFCSLIMIPFPLPLTKWPTAERPPTTPPAYEAAGKRASPRAAKTRFSVTRNGQNEQRSASRRVSCRAGRGIRTGSGSLGAWRGDRTWLRAQHATQDMRFSCLPISSATMRPPRSPACPHSTTARTCRCSARRTQQRS